MTGAGTNWRGSLVPQLARSRSFARVALISGLIWAAWHWPLILLSTNVTALGAVRPAFALVTFSLTLVGAGTVLACITLKSGSVLPAVVLHGAQNGFTHGFFLTHTAKSDISAYWLSEAGALLAVAWLIAAAATLVRTRTDKARANV